MATPDHTHEDPVERLAYNELAARYGSLYGQMTKEQTSNRILQRQVEVLKEELLKEQHKSNEAESFIADEGLTEEFEETRTDSEVEA